MQLDSKILYSIVIGLLLVATGALIGFYIYLDDYSDKTAQREGIDCRETIRYFQPYLGMIEHKNEHYTKELCEQNSNP